MTGRSSGARLIAVFLTCWSVGLIYGQATSATTNPDYEFKPEGPGIEIPRSIETPSPFLDLVIRNSSFESVNWLTGNSHYPLNKLTVRDVWMRRVENLNVLNAESIFWLKWTYSGIEQVINLPFRDLIILDLSHNAISVIEPMPEEQTRKLQLVDLSYNLLNHLGGFTYAKLKVLLLRRNNFDRLSSIFDLKHYKSLTHLDASENNIQHVHFYDLFYNKNLTELILTDNNMIRVHNGAFYSHASLQHLSLRNNKLKILDDKTFTFNKKLAQLDLAWNLFETLRPELFEPLSTLKRLDVSGNPIKRLQPQLLAANRQLTVLIARNTSVDELPYSFTSQVKNLERLIVSKSVALKKLADNVFAENRKLTVLDLGENDLESVPLSLASLSMLKLINLSGNRKLCDCDSRWLLHRYRNETWPVQIMFEHVCASADDTIESLAKLQNCPPYREPVGLQSPMLEAKPVALSTKGSSDGDTLFYHVSVYAVEDENATQDEKLSLPYDDRMLDEIIAATDPYYTNCAKAKSNAAAKAFARKSQTPDPEWRAMNEQATLNDMKIALSYAFISACVMPVAFLFHQLRYNTW